MDLAVADAIEHGRDATRADHYFFILFLLFILLIRSAEGAGWRVGSVVPRRCNVS